MTLGTPSKPRSVVTVRKARYEDLETLANISFKAFEHDTFMELLLPFDIPNRPKLFWQYLYLTTRKRLLNPRIAVIVAEVGGEIAGHVAWTRYGKGGSKVLGCGEGEGGWGYSCGPWEQWARGKVQEWENWWFGRRPKGLQDKWINHFSKTEAILREEIYDRWSERWAMSLLSVSPDHWRKGVGRALTMWGLERAKEEGGDMVVSLEASQDGRKLYEALGFAQVSWMDMPLVTGSPVMLWLPEGELPVFEWVEFGEKKSNKTV